MYAEKASLNQGIITALLSTYCIFTSLIFLFVYNERLQTKFLVGIVLMMTCVFLVALPEGGEGQVSLSLEQLYYSRLAIGLSILISIVISFFILVSRYWTEKYGYNTVDFNVDSIMLMGLMEIGFYIQHQLAVGYTFDTFAIGVAGCFFQIAGIFLLTYATTYGLAGPASSMVQVQGLVHTILGAIVMGVYPSGIQWLGILCSISGAVVMSLDLPCGRKHRSVQEAACEADVYVKYLSQSDEEALEYASARDRKPKLDENNYSPAMASEATMDLSDSSYKSLMAQPKKKK